MDTAGIHRTGEFAEGTEAHHLEGPVECFVDPELAAAAGRPAHLVPKTVGMAGWLDNRCMGSQLLSRTG